MHNPYGNDYERMNHLSGQTGASQEDLNKAGLGQHGLGSTLSPTTQATLALIEKSTRESNEQAERHRQRMLVVNPTGAAIPRAAGPGAAFYFKRLGKALVVMTGLFLMVLFVPLDRGLHWTASMVSGTSSYELTDPSFYDTHLKPYSARTKAENIEQAQLVLTQANYKGISPSWKKADAKTRNSLKALWAASLQGYEPVFETSRPARYVSYLTRDMLTELHKQTKSPVPLDDTGAAWVRTIGKHIDHEDLGIVMRQAAEVGGTPLTQSRAASTKSWRWNTAIVLDLVARMYEGARMVARYIVEQVRVST